MTLYVAARLLHICGALGIFMTLGVDLASITSLVRARTTGQVRRAIESGRLNALLGPISLLLLLAPGMYMATTTWAWASWIRVSFVVLLVMAGLGAGVTRQRLTRIQSSLENDDRPLGAGVERLVRDPLLHASFALRAMLALAVVLIMSLKPDLTTALTCVTGAVLVAAAISAPFWRRARALARAA
jgi:hypothetical protein